jgi:acyl carrier protein
MTEREAAVAREIVRIAREELKLEGEPPAPAPQGAPEAERGFAASMDLDAPLAERLDSLALLGLVVAVEDRFHVILGDDEAAGARSLADLARIVAGRAAPERLPAPAAEGTP